MRGRSGAARRSHDRRASAELCRAAEDAAARAGIAPSRDRHRGADAGGEVSGNGDDGDGDAAIAQIAITRSDSIAATLDAHRHAFAAAGRRCVDARRRDRRAAGCRLRRSPRARLRQRQGRVTRREYPADTGPRVRGAFDRLPDRGCTRRARARPLRGAEGRPRADVRVARGAVRADLHRGRADRRRRAALPIARHRRRRDARAARALGTVLPWRRNRAAARAPVQLQRPDPLLLAAAGVAAAVEQLFDNLARQPVPETLVAQWLPDVQPAARAASRKSRARGCATGYAT